MHKNTHSLGLAIDPCSFQSLNPRVLERSADWNGVIDSRIDCSFARSSLRESFADFFNALLCGISWGARPSFHTQLFKQSHLAAAITKAPNVIACDIPLIGSALKQSHLAAVITKPPDVIAVSMDSEGSRLLHNVGTTLAPSCYQDGTTFVPSWYQYGTKMVRALNDNLNTLCDISTNINNGMTTEVPIIF